MKISQALAIAASFILLPFLMIQPPSGTYARTVATASETFKFELFGGEKVKFGVKAVAGPISVSSTTQGAAVRIALVAPGGNQVVAQSTGNGQPISATVAKGQEGVWLIEVGESSNSNTIGRQVASGLITVTSTTGDKSVMDNLQAAATAKQNSASLAASKSQMLAAATQARQSLIAKENQEQKAKHDALRTQALQKYRQMAKVSANTVAPGFTAKIGANGQTTITANNPQQASTSSNSGGNASGTTTPASGGAKPGIKSLDRASGDPGTPVLITGHDFTNAQGEVHFIINPGMDVSSPIEPGTWSDTQIMAYVPDASAIQAFDGQMYVKTSGGKSDMMPFHFDPALDTQTIAAKLSICGLPKVADFPMGGCWVGDDNLTFYGQHQAGLWSGSRDDDQYNSVPALKNGWVVDTVNFQKTSDSNGSADAYVSESHEGTSNLFVKIHWWNTPAFGSVSYTLTMTIKGPKGVAYQ